MAHPAPAPDRLLADLGQSVRRARGNRSLSLRELAQRSGLSTRFLVDVEAGAGNISVKKLAALAEALATTPAALLTRSEATPAARVVALLGLRGAGKTTIGRRLARRIHIPFVELDRRVEEAAGLTLNEIFALHGEEYYRRLEQQALLTLLGEARPLVIATGGGIVNAPETYALLNSRCLTIWLRARPEDHWNRVVQQGDRRPMADHPEAMAELRRILALREPLYATAAHTVDTSGRDLESVVEAAALVAAQGRPGKSPPGAR